MHRVVAVQPAIPDARQRASLAVGVVAIGTLVFTASDDGIVLCPFRRCTGGYCPACGATRATRAFAHGDIGAAWAHSPWVVVAAIQAAVVGVLATRAAPGGRLERTLAIGRRLAWPNLVLLTAIWVVRLVDGSVPRFW